ncbi:MAG: hypothetical protein AAF494_01070 [Pseudomonadota bacterium]
MFRTETTLIIGAGANREIEMPDGPELLNRIAAGFDFDRLGTQVQSRDIVALAQIFEEVSGDLGTTAEELMNAGRAIRSAAYVTPSIEMILQQQNDDPLVVAAGKLAIIYYTLQAEAKSTLARAPREEGELPLRGQENWLFKLGQMMVSGVPRTEVEECFFRLSIIAFTYDRAIEHYLPWVAAMAFDLDIEEARAIVGTHLRIVHPLGMAGYLPWQDTEKPKADWGDEAPENIRELTRTIYLASQRKEDRRFSSYLLAEMAQGRRIGFMGFGFDPVRLEMIFDYPMDHNPEVLLSAGAIEEQERPAIARLVKRQTGLTDDALLTVFDGGAFEMLRDNAVVLES